MPADLVLFNGNIHTMDPAIARAEAVAITGDRVLAVRARLPEVLREVAAPMVELDASVAPRRGRALIFQHRIMHRACEVAAGEKYVLRTDILYGPA